MFKEFKEFAIKGNAIDLAIGVIIGTAFGKIVDSLVKDIIMPPLGLVLGNVDLSHLYWTLSDKGDAPLILNYGMFLNVLFNFVIIAFVIFLMVKQMNRFRGQPQKLPDTKPCPHCQTAVHVAATRCPACTSQLT